MKLIDAFRERDYPAFGHGAEIYRVAMHNRRALRLQGLLWFLLMAAGMAAAFLPLRYTP